MVQLPGNNCPVCPRTPFVSAPRGWTAPQDRHLRVLVTFNLKRIVCTFSGASCLLPCSPQGPPLPTVPLPPLPRLTKMHCSRAGVEPGLRPSRPGAQGVASVTQPGIYSCSWPGPPALPPHARLSEARWVEGGARPAWQGLQSGCSAERLPQADSWVQVQVGPPPQTARLT